MAFQYGNNMYALNMLQPLQYYDEYAFLERSLDLWLGFLWSGQPHSMPANLSCLVEKWQKLRLIKPKNITILDQNPVLGI